MKVHNCTHVYLYLGFPGSSAGKESACNVGDLSSIPGLGRSAGGGHGNPLQHSCLENLHGQRSLEGYSPWGRREWDRTEGLSSVYAYIRASLVAQWEGICLPVQETWV